MHKCMQAALQAICNEYAIALVSKSRPSGLPKGLGVSFGCKHLRMLDPDRFAVLDSILNNELGYALNPKGYALFMRHFRLFHQQLPTRKWPHSLARTEAGMFMLVRSLVTATVRS